MYDARWLLGLLVVLLGSCGSKSGLNVAGGDAGGDAGGGDSGRDSCTPTPEICNGIDDDCDGVIDDGVACFSLNGRFIDPVPSVGCGAQWYGYNAPDPESANPVPDIRRSGEVVVAVQSGPACGGAHIALIADLPQDGSGGQLDLDFEITPASAGGVVVADEPGECDYDASSGTGRCEFVWQPCCTDGVLLGEFTSDSCVRLTASNQAGVTRLVVLDGAAGEVAQDFGTSFELCSQIRPEVP